VLWAWLACSWLAGPAVVESAVPGVDRPAALEAELREHLDDPDARFVNRLARASSPYLRDHATNPVDWYEWGDEAFTEAARTGRLVFISIGYHTCHWCHVMAHESFEDEEIAEVLNTRFVPIKVDREQRPDVDEIYMDAVQMLTGRGGWPLTAVLTPDGEPVFAATYLPARDGDRGARSGLLSVLTVIAEQWAADPDGLERAASEITRRLVAAARPAPPGDLPGLDLVERAVDELRGAWDEEHGGFGGAPKFPTPLKLDLLLAEAARRGEPDLRTSALHTLHRMARGGIHDVLGGGFHRYTVDRAWRIPHFEKMLYDNAQLLRTYARAAAVTGDAELRGATRATARFLVEELTLEDGTLFAGLDADSRTPDGHLEEGAYYTWTPAEVRAAVPDADVGFALTRFGVTPGGNLDGRSVLWLERAAPGSPRVDEVRRALLAARRERAPPARDEQAVVAWNALAISGLVRAWRTLGERRWLAAAERAADAVLAGAHDPDHRLSRLASGGPPAVLEDEAHAAVAALDLFGATGERRWLEVARARVAVVARHFADPAGGWFRTPDDGEMLLRRPKPRFEGAEPSGATTAIEAVLRLAHLTDGSTGPADRALRAYAEPLEAVPLGLPGVLRQVVRRHAPRREIVVVWPDETDPGPLLDVLGGVDRPHAEIVTAPASRLATVRAVPWLEGKVPRDALPTAYVCTDGVCQLPVTDPAGFERALTVQ